MRFAKIILEIVVGLSLTCGFAWAKGGDLRGLGSSGSGDRFEAVITPHEDGVSRLYLVDMDSNAPIAGADVQVDVTAAKPWSGKAVTTGIAGIYRLPWTPPVGEAVDFTLTIMGEAGDDLILIQVEAPLQPVVQPPVVEKKYFINQLVGLGLVLIGWLIFRSRRKGVVTVAIVLLVGGGGNDAFSHGGEDHGTPSEQGDTLTPGRVVPLPKESQFLLEVRTVVAKSNEVAETIRLVGKVIPDPAAHARIHPSLPARVGFDRDFPPPTSGQWVKQGQTLAVLDPIMTTTEKTAQRLSLFRGERPDSMMGREMILAPINGQLTDVHVIPGEVVSESTILAEIIDPNRLWVEAVLYDLPLSDRIVAGMAASRQIPGRTFSLALVGVSPAVNPENQGLHVQFAVKGNAGYLKPGMPVDVYAQTGLVSFGVAIPRIAVIDHGGLPRVWIKSGAEQFEARQVQVGRRTGEWVEILAGVKVGDKVVVQGHNQINAIR